MHRGLSRHTRQPASGATAALPVVFPKSRTWAKAGQSLLLLEIDDPSLDLSGDTGAVGRLFAREENGAVRVEIKGTEYHGAVLPAAVSDRVQRGALFAPFHWNDVYGEYLAVNAVTNDAVDPLSFQPEFKIAAMNKTIAFPADPWGHAGDPRLLLALLLTVVGLSNSLAWAKRQGS